MTDILDKSKVQAAAKILAAEGAAKLGYAPGSWQYQVYMRTYDAISNAGMYGIDKLNNCDTCKKIVQTGDAAFALWQTDASGLVRTFQREDFSTPDGVLDFTYAFGKFTQGLGQFMTKLGANSAGKVIGDWGAITAGCAAGIAAQHVFGAVACAFTVVTTFLSKVLGNESTFTAPVSVPRAIFSANADVMPMIIGDAFMLAQLLRHHYKVPSYEYLWNRLPHQPSIADQRFVWLNEPPKPIAGTTADKPTPAHTLRTILSMLNWSGSVSTQPGVYYGTDYQTRQALTFLASYRKDIDGRSGRNLLLRYDDDNDINVETVNAGAFFGRSAIATNGTTTLYVGINPAVTSPIPLGEVNFESFIRLSELIEFFSASIFVDLLEGQSPWEKYHPGVANPVRLRLVREHDRTGIPPEDGGGGDLYNKNCFTNLTRVADNTCQDLDDYIERQNPLAIREFAALRLCAAFTYLHLQYWWSSDTASSRRDPIRDIEPTNDLLRLPIDPRTAAPKGNAFAQGWKAPWNLFDGHSGQKMPPYTIGEGYTAVPIVAAPVAPNLGRFCNAGKPCDAHFSYPARDYKIIASEIREKNTIATEAIKAAQQFVVRMRFSQASTEQRQAATYAWNDTVLSSTDPRYAIEPVGAAQARCAQAGGVWNSNTHRCEPVGAAGGIGTLLALAAGGYLLMKVMK